MVLKPSKSSLTDRAAASRRRQEYLAQERAWRLTEGYLDLAAFPPNVRTRIKSAFLAGWQGATNFHTATVNTR